MSIQTIIDRINAWMPGATDNAAEAFLRNLHKVHKDPKDPNDYKASQADFSKVKFSNIPKKSSESQYDSLPRNQGHREICVSERTRSAAESFYNEKNGCRDSNFSPEFINYYAEQWDNHDPEGTYPRLGCKALKEKGIPIYGLYPVMPRFSDVQEPPLFVIEDAERRRCKAYYRAGSIQQICKAIYRNDFNRKRGIPNRYYVGGSFKIFKSILGCTILPMPQKYERSLGIHDMRIADYDLTKQWFKIRNSWGLMSHDAGYLYMSFEYFKKYKGDIWVIEYE